MDIFNITSGDLGVIVALVLAIVYLLTRIKRIKNKKPLPQKEGQNGFY